MQAIKTLSLSDTRGKRSKTLFMVWACLIVLLAKFFVGGIDIGFGTFPVITGTEFGLAATGLIGAWVMRESKAKELDHAKSREAQP